MTGELAERIWQWLPARTDSRRVTLPSTIAIALDATAREVAETIADMERRGHVVRDRATGRQSGWHRGAPLPGAPPAEPPPPELTLY